MTDIERLYRDYFHTVYLYVLGVTSDKHLAEDITAETFLMAIDAIDGFNGKCDIRVWLCQIAKNTYFSYLRKNRRTALNDMPELTPDPFLVENALADSDEAQRIHEILHTLNEPYKEVFTLRVFCELSFGQIGKLFGKTDNWACVTYHRAKTAIKERMEKQNETAL